MIEFTDGTFEEQVLKASGLVVVDFWATWCGPCKMIAPVLEELSKEYDGKVTFGKVNVDDEAEVTSQFGIMNIPTILFFKNGELVDRTVGALPKDLLKEKIDAHL